MKLLVVGVNGMLGSSVAGACGGEVVGTYNDIFVENNFNDMKLDVTNREEVDRVIKSVRPEIVVNCAAITNVDVCEDAPHLAEKVHVFGTRNLSQSCREIGAKFVHISTDFVFDGAKGNYTEGDETSPVNTYGKTKLAGEKTLHDDDLLIRTCIFGINVVQKKSMVEWIAGDLAAGKNISVFGDSFFTPIYTGHLAKIILDMASKDMKGIYNVASTKRVSKYEFALAVADVFGLDKKLISPSSVREFVRKARRPVDTSLVCTKAIGSGIRLNDFKEEIKLMKDDWNRS